MMGFEPTYTSLTGKFINQLWYISIFESRGLDRTNIYSCKVSLSTIIRYPNLYMIYGIEEGEWVSKENEYMKKVYAESNSFAHINSFVGGHDYRIWNAELIKLLTKLFSTNK